MNIGYYTLELIKNKIFHYFLAVCVVDSSLSFFGKTEEINIYVEKNFDKNVGINLCTIFNKNYENFNAIINEKYLKKFSNAFCNNANFSDSKLKISHSNYSIMMEISVIIKLINTDISINFVLLLLSFDKYFSLKCTNNFNTQSPVVSLLQILIIIKIYLSFLVLKICFTTTHLSQTHKKVKIYLFKFIFKHRSNLHEGSSTDAYIYSKSRYFKNKIQHSYENLFQLHNYNILIIHHD